MLVGLRFGSLTMWVRSLELFQFLIMKTCIILRMNINDVACIILNKNNIKPNSNIVDIR